MLSISHAVTGAFIAQAVPDPLVSIPLILIAHYLADAVPHWDAGTGLTAGTKSPRKAILLEIPDLLLAAVFVYIFFPFDFRISNFAILSYPQIWGAFLGLLPDFLEAPRNFLRRDPWLLRPLNRFHRSFHHSIPHVAAGLAPQVILLTLLWFLR